MCNLATLSAEHIANFKTQEISCTCWGFAIILTLKNTAVTSVDERGSGKYLQTNEGVFFRQLPARTHRVFDHFFMKIAKDLQQRLTNFRSQELSNTAWAFAKGTADHRDMKELMASGKAGNPLSTIADFLHALAYNCTRRTKHFYPQHLANTAWSFAKMESLLRRTDIVHLFDALADAAIEQVGDAKPQEISTIAWAFGKVQVSKPKLFQKIAANVIAALKDGQRETDPSMRYRPQDYTHLAFAFSSQANAKKQHLDLFEIISARAKEDLASFKPIEMGEIAVVFGKIRDQSETISSFVKDLSQVGLYRLDSFGPHELSSFAWGMALGGYLHGDMLYKVKLMSKRMQGCFRQQDLAQLASAFKQAYQTDDKNRGKPGSF